VKKTMKVLMMISIFLLGGIVYGKDLTGFEIIKNVYERPQGEKQTADMTMILENSRGDQRIRKIKQFSKDYGNVEKKVMFFVSPADVKNTSFMNWTYSDEKKTDEQWIYLPALKRVKRISSDSRDDYFMGSDFTYDDLGDRKPEEDTHRLLKTENLDGKDCYVIESISKDEDYIYSKTITWIIKDNYIGLKKEFYDEDEDLLKVLNIKEIITVDGIETIVNSEMEDVQKEHKTMIKLENLQYDFNISDRTFTERTMTRGY